MSKYIISEENILLQNELTNNLIQYFSPPLFEKWWTHIAKMSIDEIGNESIIIERDFLISCMRDGVDYRSFIYQAFFDRAIVISKCIAEMNRFMEDIREIVFAQEFISNVSGAEFIFLSALGYMDIYLCRENRQFALQDEWMIDEIFDDFSKALELSSTFEWLSDYDKFQKAKWLLPMFNIWDYKFFPHKYYAMLNELFDNAAMLLLPWFKVKDDSVMFK